MEATLATRSVCFRHWTLLFDYSFCFPTNVFDDSWYFLDEFIWQFTISEINDNLFTFTYYLTYGNLAILSDSKEFHTLANPVVNWRRFLTLSDWSFYPNVTTIFVDLQTIFFTFHIFIFALSSTNKRISLFNQMQIRWISSLYPNRGFSQWVLLLFFNVPLFHFSDHFPNQDTFGTPASSRRISVSRRDDAPKYVRGWI